MHSYTSMSVDVHNIFTTTYDSIRGCLIRVESRCGHAMRLTIEDHFGLENMRAALDEAERLMQANSKPVEETPNAD